MTPSSTSPEGPRLTLLGKLFVVLFVAACAFGAYFLIRRRAMGPAGNAIIGQWIFWLAFNLWFSFSQPGIGYWDHIGGLIAGFVLGILFTNMTIAQRSR